MAGMYVVYHGAEGMKRIANNINKAARFLAIELEKLGYKLKHKEFFDTIFVEIPEGLKSKDIQAIALKNKMNFRYCCEKYVEFY